MQRSQYLVSRRSMLFGMTGFGLAIALNACSNSSSSTTDKGIPLKVGSNVGNVPWEFRDEDGILVGFEVDLVNLIGERLERPIEFVDMPFTELFPAVLSGRIDLAISSITITAERMETLDFAQPYYDSDQSLLALSDSGVQSLADMQGRVVVVDSGSTGDAWVQKHTDVYQFASIKRVEGLTNAMLALESGECDGYVSDLPTLLYFAKSHPEVAVVERIATGEQYSMMFAKGNPLRDQANELLTAFKEEGIIAEIHETWFGKAPDDNTSTVAIAAVPQLP
jgi:polar amino acid transport system substrate-binding protein